MTHSHWHLSFLYLFKGEILWKTNFATAYNEQIFISRNSFGTCYPIFDKYPAMCSCRYYKVLGWMGKRKRSHEAHAIHQWNKMSREHKILCQMVFDDRYREHCCLFWYIIIRCLNGLSLHWNQKFGFQWYIWHWIFLCDTSNTFKGMQFPTDFTIPPLNNKTILQLTYLGWFKYFWENC